MKKQGAVKEERMIKLNPEQIDLLMELGNIGSGNAVKALSILLNKRIEMSLTHVNVVPFWEITEVLNDLESEVFGICSEIKDYTKLTIFQFFNKESVLNIVGKLSGTSEILIDKIKDISDLDEFTLSVVLEVGSILGGNYLSALANLLSIKLIPEVPYIALDTLETILNTLASICSSTSDYIIFIETKIDIEDYNLDGHFCFMPDLETLQKIFRGLNLDYEISFLT